ncbi:hypothetical protein I4U23_019624 [Adineta vaga]|nr:hypothetical protein I4U23_019624 [Adineta vaga]
MSANASATNKSLCITCNKSTGILICHGCQCIFCGKHVIQHRQELAGQLDTVIQEHDLIQHKISELSVDQSSFEKIDQWEKEYIAKIRCAAEASRTNLKKLTEQTKEKLAQTCRDIAISICTSREADDYAENELVHWREQLTQLKSQSLLPYSIKITEDQKSITHSIIHEKMKSNKNQSVDNKQPSASTISLNSRIQDKFLNVFGPITLENGGCIAKHTSASSEYGYIQSQLLYSTGRHIIRFQIEKCNRPYHIFFGCKSSQTALSEHLLNLPDVVGWFGFNQVYEQGRCSTNCKKYHYRSNSIEQNDMIHVQFDCIKNEIHLSNPRLNTINILKVDINKTPYSWRLLVILSHKNDCVRMLGNL